MEYRKLGKTGWNVSVVGYGAAPLGGVYGKLDEKEGVRSVHTAIDLGGVGRVGRGLTEDSPERQLEISEFQISDE